MSREALTLLGSLIEVDLEELLVALNGQRVGRQVESTVARIKIRRAGRIVVRAVAVVVVVVAEITVIAAATVLVLICILICRV